MDSLITFFQNHPDYPFFAIFLFAISGIVSQQILFNRIKEHHPEKWVELGQPSMWNMSQRNNWRYTKLLFKGDPVLAGDMRINGLIDLNRALSIITILAVIAFFGYHVMIGINSIPVSVNENGSILQSD